MAIVSLIAAAFSAILLLQFLTYLYALKIGRIDIVDSVWGMSFIVGALGLQIIQPSDAASVLIVDSLVLIWGLRLVWHIYRRFRRSAQQDTRYTTLVARWPKRLVKLQLFAKISLVQAILATLISLPVIAIHAYQPDISWVILIGFTIWCLGFLCESIADKQLKTFLSQPNHAPLMSSGLWKYSRHPNYFGEVSMWWGIAVIAAATPVWWLGIIGALTITLLICFVSGIPPAEKQAATKPGWQDYKAKTSPLILWPPKQL